MRLLKDLKKWIYFFLVITTFIFSSCQLLDTGEKKIDNNKEATDDTNTDNTDDTNTDNTDDTNTDNTDDTNIDNTDDTNIDTSNIGVLKALGMNPDGYSAERLDRNGKPMKSSQPYGYQVINAAKQDEIFLVYANDTTFHLLNPALITGTSSLTLNSAALSQSAGLIKRPVAADMDGNGKEEIITAVFSPVAKTISFYGIADGATYSQTLKKTIPWNVLKTYPDMSDWNAGSSTDFGRTRDWNHTIDIASGNLNGIEKDGRRREEIVLVSESTLYVLGHDFSEIITLTIPMLTGAKSQILRVEIGDLDNDNRSEIVVANGTYDSGFTAEVYIYKLDTTNKLVLADQRSISSGSVSMRAAEIAIGNVVGDGKPEIVLAGLKSSDRENIAVLAVQTNPSGSSLGVSFVNASHSDDINSQVWNYWTTDGWKDPRGQDHAIPILTLADMDGNGVSEIVAGDDILTLKLTGTAYSFDYAFSTTSNEILRKDLSNEFLPGWGGVWGGRAPDTAYFNQVQAGDIFGEGRKSVVVLDYMKKKLRVYRYNSNTLQVYQDTPITSTSIEAGGSCPYLCLADIDSDGLILEYVGHTLSFTKPQIVAVLASPPYWDIKNASAELIQYTDSMGTTFGVSAGASVGTGMTFGVSGGLKAGAEGTIPLFSNGKAKTTHTVSVSVDVDFDVVASTQASYSISCDAGYDSVIFTAVPIDYYCYKVLQADSSQNAEGDLIKAGDILTISLPRNSVLHATTVDFFNANNGDYADINKSILTHTIGNPKSYIKKSVALTKLNLNPMSFLLDNIGAGIVPQGPLLNTISYENSLSVGVSVVSKVTYTNDTEVAFIGLAGFTYSVYGGTKLSFESNIGSLVEGSVGGLRDGYYTSDYQYNWGICSYPETISGYILPSVIITYWVN